MNAEQSIPLPPTGKVGRKISPLTEAMRELAAGPLMHSLHFRPQELGYNDSRTAQMRIAASAQGAAGPGWFATRRTETGTRIWKIAHPSNPPPHFSSGRDGGGDKSSPVAG